MHRRERIKPGYSFRGAETMKINASALWSFVVAILFLFFSSLLPNILIKDPEQL
jgi:hypothetical protein